jgi:hypothetical protein
LLEERKHNMELELNAKKREKEKLAYKILQMSEVQEPSGKSRKLKTEETKERPIRPMSKPVQERRVEPEESRSPPSPPPPQFDYSRLQRGRPLDSRASKSSSYLGPEALLDGTEKILKFNLNKEGKSEEDKLIESIMAQ